MLLPQSKLSQSKVYCTVNVIIELGDAAQFIGDDCVPVYSIGVVYAILNQHYFMSNLLALVS